MGCLLHEVQLLLCFRFYRLGHMAWTNSELISEMAYPSSHMVGLLDGEDDQFLHITIIAINMAIFLLHHSIVISVTWNRRT
jgi:hypothetical protein